MEKRLMIILILQWKYMKIKEKTESPLKLKQDIYLKLWTPKTMKLLGSTESKTTKAINDEDVPCSEITEVVLIHCNIVNKDY